MSYNVTIQLDVPPCGSCHRPASGVDRTTIEGPSMRLVSTALGKTPGVHPLNYLGVSTKELLRQLSTARETMLTSPLVYMGMAEVVMDSGSYMLPERQFEKTIAVLDKLIDKLAQYPQATIAYDVY